VTTEEIRYTPSEPDKNTALAVIGWTLREEHNRLAGSGVRGVTGDHARETADAMVAMIQRAWDRYIERVGRQ